MTVNMWLIGLSWVCGKCASLTCLLVVSRDVGLLAGGAWVHSMLIKAGYPDWYVPYDTMREKMKKILFATTALIATAGIASAEVAITGFAEMGIMGGDNGVNASGDQFVTDVDVNFSMSGESDNGITFGASIDLDESDGSTATQTTSNAFGDGNQGGETIFVSGDFGTLTMGDTDGALDQAVAETDIMGDITDASTESSVISMGFMDGSADGNGQVARYDYSVAGFGLSVSAETPNGTDDKSTFGLGATYTVALGGADLDLGIGYQGGGTVTSVLGNATGSTGTGEGWGLSAGTTVAGVELVANYAEGIVNISGAKDPVVKMYGVAAAYSIDALKVGINYGEAHVDYDSGAVNIAATQKGFGLAAEYDLGGGLKVLAGYGEASSETAGFDAVTSDYSLGLKMAF